MNAPVRVLSDGSDAAPSATVGAPQTANGSTAGAQSVSGSDGAAQVASPSVSAPIRVVSDGDGKGVVGVGAQGAPVAPVDEGSAPDGGTEADGGPVSVTESIPGTAPGTETFDDRGANGAETRPVSAVLGVSAESLPVTGFGLGAMFLTGLVLLSAGAALRRGGVAAG